MKRMNGDVFGRVMEAIKRSDGIMIATHIRADGDAIAAACFFGKLLTALGKMFRMVLDEPVPDLKYGFLDGFERFESAGDLPVEFHPDLVIILDTPTFGRLGSIAGRIPKDSFIINIDHHISNEGFGGIDIVDPEMSSTCEILVGMVRRYPEFMDGHCAEILYTGICFDTGRFRFANTRSGTFRAAAYLVENGARPDRISENLFYGWSHLRARILGKILSGMQLEKNGRIVVLKLENDFFRENPDGWQELEGVSDLGVSLKGAEVSLFLKEIDPGRYKVSLRSTGKWDVGRAASYFGGGGHPMAAGCELTGDYEPTVRKLIRAVERFPVRVHGCGDHPHSE
ncbi:bifunctional oligoribonuclease/PAP phosphatase NrnA [bacterium]|nr:bifunctional oligoribonuclease/PAP phosphatase NrnA [candidate division CSSED10-310 bacterium]